MEKEKPTIEPEPIEHFGIAGVPVRTKRKFNELRARAGTTQPLFLEELLRFYEAGGPAIKPLEPAVAGVPQAPTTKPENEISETCQRDIADAKVKFEKGNELITSRVAEYLQNEYLRPGLTRPKADVEAVRAFLNLHRPEKKNIKTQLGKMEGRK